MPQIKYALIRSGFFDFTEAATASLDRYVRAIGVEDELAENAVEVLESCAAEVAMLTTLYLPYTSAPRLAPYVVTQDIAMLTTAWYGCNPFLTCKERVERLRPDKFNWGDIVIFVGDATKAESVWRIHWSDQPLNSLPEKFPEFAAKYAAAQKEWMQLVFGEAGQKLLYPVTSMQLALWRIRIEAIFGQRDVELLLKSFTEVLSMAI